jgi:hypothetical protein
MVVATVRFYTRGVRTVHKTEHLSAAFGSITPGNPNFGDCIKKDVKDVMDADELRNKIKYVSTACLAGIRPSLRHGV